MISERERLRNSSEFAERPSLNGHSKHRFTDVSDLCFEVLIRPKWKVIEANGVVCILIPGRPPRPPTSCAVAAGVALGCRVFLTHRMGSVSNGWGFCL